MLTGRGILRQALGAEQANAVPLNFPMRKSPLFLTVNLSTPCLRFVSFFFFFPSLVAVEAANEGRRRIY